MKIKPIISEEFELNEENEQDIDDEKKSLNKSDNYSLYKIPYKENEYELIKKIHENCNHRNWDDTRKEFLKNKYYYVGYTYDIKYIVSRCPICSQKNKNFYKREPCKFIIFNKPKDRYILDLTGMPINLDDDNKYQYILNIIDHFSKLCKSYLLKNKKSITILFKIEDFFREYGLPLSVGTDNGREFKNILITNFMKEHNINYVHGLPYKPHSQGVCERVHKTIKTSLMLKKLEKNKNFDLAETLEEINNTYNKTIHNVTNATPYEVFFSTNDKFLKGIKNNIIKYYNKKSNDNLYVELDDKILISSNIMTKKSKKDNLIIIEKNKVKSNNQIYQILGEVIKIHEAGIYDILVAKDYKNYNLKKNDVCRISRELFKVIPFHIYEELKKKID